MQPFARLLEAGGQVYRQPPAFVAEVRVALASEAVSAGSASGNRGGQGAPAPPPLRSLAGC
jgi:hypothetical protein